MNPCIGLRKAGSIAIAITLFTGFAPVSAQNTSSTPAAASGVPQPAARQPVERFASRPLLEQVSGQGIEEDRYIEQEGGDHHLSQYAHRLEFFKALEAFLDRHLQVRD
jgi:hypothetical protein